MTLKRVFVNQAEEEFWTQLWYNEIAKKKEREDHDAQQAKAKSDSMTKVIREQMQAVEAERNLQKSKRKEHSDAAVNIFIYLIIHHDFLCSHLVGTISCSKR